MEILSFLTQAQQPQSNKEVKQRSVRAQSAGTAARDPRVSSDAISPNSCQSEGLPLLKEFAVFCSSVPRRSFPFAAGVDFSPRELRCPACCVHGTERSLAGGVSSGLLAMLSSTPVWDIGAVLWMLPMQALLAHVMFSLFGQARFCFLNLVFLGSILSLLIVFLQDPEKLYKSVMQRRFPMSTCSPWCPEPAATTERSCSPTPISCARREGGEQGFYQIFPEGRGLHPPQFLPHGREQHGWECVSNAGWISALQSQSCASQGAREV